MKTITPAIKRRLIKIIKADCMIQGSFIDGSGLTCAVGELALKAGCSERTVRRCNDYGVTSLDHPPVRAIVRRIGAKFGLDSDQLYDIQSLNDTTARLRSRRAKIAAYIQSL